MNIIKQSNIQVACKECNAILEIFQSDVIYNDMNEKNPAYYCHCSVCNKIIDLENYILYRWKRID
jgi:hypothetical protein